MILKAILIIFAMLSGFCATGAVVLDGNGVFYLGGYYGS